MSDLVAMALEVCGREHAGQLDKGGTAYVYHPLAVMRIAAAWEDYVPVDLRCADREALAATCLLHDVVEDCRPEDSHATADAIMSDFGTTISGAVKLLTRGYYSDQTYDQYIAHLLWPETESSDIARRVKRADLVHNSDLTRLPPVARTTYEARCRTERYQRHQRVIETRIIGGPS